MARRVGPQDFRCNFYSQRSDEMPIRNAEAEWNFIEGAGHLRFGSGAFEAPYSFKRNLHGVDRCPEP